MLATKWMWDVYNFCTSSCLRDFGSGFKKPGHNDGCELYFFRIKITIFFLLIIKD